MKDGKTFKVETESEALVGKKIGESIKGEDVSGDLSGYEFEIMGTSDHAGFPGTKDREGANLKRVLLTYGLGMKKKCRKEGKKSRGNLKREGLRLKRSLRGNEISEDTIQINLKVVKQGGKKLVELFPDQNKKKEEAKPEQAPTEGIAPEAQPAAEAPKPEEKPAEQPKPVEVAPAV